MLVSNQRQSQIDFAWCNLLSCSNFLRRRFECRDHRSQSVILRYSEELGDKTLYTRSVKVRGGVAVAEVDVCNLSPHAVGLLSEFPYTCLKMRFLLVHVRLLTFVVAQLRQIRL